MRYLKSKKTILHSYLQLIPGPGCTVQVVTIVLPSSVTSIPAFVVDVSDISPLFSRDSITFSAPVYTTLLRETSLILLSTLKTKKHSAVLFQSCFCKLCITFPSCCSHPPPFM